MKLYMGFDRQVGSEEGSILIFASSAKEARKIGWGFVRDWFDTEWIHMAIKRIKTNIHHLEKNANQKMLKAGISHVIDSPEICPGCEMWGGGEPENGKCEHCFEWED